MTQSCLSSGHTSSGSLGNFLWLPGPACSSCSDTCSTWHCGLHITPGEGPVASCRGSVCEWVFVSPTEAFRQICPYGSGIIVGPDDSAVGECLVLDSQRFLIFSPSLFLVFSPAVLISPHVSWKITLYFFFVFPFRYQFCYCIVILAISSIRHGNDHNLPLCFKKVTLLFTKKYFYVLYFPPLLKIWMSAKNLMSVSTGSASTPTAPIAASVPLATFWKGMNAWVSNTVFSSPGIFTD